MSEGSFPKDITPPQFEQLRDLIQAASGIHVDDHRLDALRISLVARGTRLGCSNLDDYLRVIATDAAELDELLELVTINETSFFRFPQQFDALRSVVLPELVARAEREGRPLRIWSAGCSTGEEAYSIAMALADAGVSGTGRAVVLGTDVSTRALEAARAAIYGRRAVVNVPAEILAHHFEEIDGGYRVKPRVRRLVEFRQHNLVSDLGPEGAAEPWDAIFCRNVTIYFRLESTERVIARFYDGLVPGGYLFIGHSETLTPFDTGFEAVEVDGVYLYRKPPAGAAPSASRSSAERPARPGGQHAEASAGGTTPAATRRPGAGRRPGLESGALDDAHRHADAGDLDAAAAACERALAADPLLVGARYLLAVVRQRQGSAVRALEEFRRTVYTDPDFALAHLSMANIHKAEHRWEAAARGYENTLGALTRSPEGPWTAFLGGFRVELLVASCERSLAECRDASGQEQPVDR
jgi:chemotaxis protein methyltransferase CheR